MSRGGLWAAQANTCFNSFFKYKNCISKPRKALRNSYFRNRQQRWDRKHFLGLRHNQGQLLSWEAATFGGRMMRIYFCVPRFPQIWPVILALGFTQVQHQVLMSRGPYGWPPCAAKPISAERPLLCQALPSRSWAKQCSIAVVHVVTLSSHIKYNIHIRAAFGNGLYYSHSGVWVLPVTVLVVGGEKLPWEQTNN